MIPKWILFFFFLCLSTFSLNAQFQYAGIIPKPREIHPGAYLSGIQTVYFSNALQNNASLFIWIAKLSRSMPCVPRRPGQSVNLVLSTNKDLGTESYTLQIKNDSILIQGGDEAGLQYALTSLVQLAELNKGHLPILRITDSPRFHYRGMHLDVCRHFFSVADIKKYLDYMAYYKFNTFHWHLTDDQGWRIEIKQYPKLEEVAAYRKETLVGHDSDRPHQFDGKRYGGYYKQIEIRDIVAYAIARHIEVIPEIEMPGHSQALLAAYPELGCNDGPQDVATSWGVFENVLCPKDTTFHFLEHVIDELCLLFPSRYIHIGGDECPKTSWKKSDFCQGLMQKESLKDENELQSYFIHRIEKYIESKGKQIIGWDEILEGGLAPDATVMSWRGESGGIEAARAGHDVIMSPTDYCYFDYYQSESDQEPLAIGGFLPINKVYAWEPVPAELERDKTKHILGGQSNLWTEYISDYSSVEYMAYARAMAMSEVLWSPEKDYQDFIQRFQFHFLKWKEEGVNIANHMLDLIPIIKTDASGVHLSFTIPHEAFVDYTFHNKVNRLNGNDGMEIDSSGEYTFVGHQGGVDGKPLELDFKLHKGTHVEINMSPLPDQKYGGNGPSSIINGLTGSDEKYGGTEWLGFSGNDCDATLTFTKKEMLHHLSFRFFKGEGQWIYLPRKIELWTSTDGVEFRPLTSVDKIETETKISTVNLTFKTVQAKYLRWRIYNFGIIPEGRQGAGQKSWLFIDEVTIE